MRGGLTRQRIAKVMERWFPPEPGVVIDRGMLRASLANCEEEVRQMQELFERVKSRQTAASDTRPPRRIPVHLLR